MSANQFSSPPSLVPGSLSSLPSLLVSYSGLPSILGTSLGKSSSSTLLLLLP